jgi:excisionase family DNA binding protein
MKKTTSEIYFTPKQAADYFNLSLSTVKNYIYAGKLRTLKTPGGHHRISKAAILTALGEVSLNPENTRDNLRYNLCRAILSLFKTFGNHADYFINHGQNVSRLAGITAKAMNMPVSDIAMAEMAGLVHDIGLVGIEKYIVLKNGILSPLEYSSIKMHCVIGSEMLSSVPELADISDIVMQHHERADGAGYPKGLDSTKIKEHSKIISIAEAYDSMVTESFYKTVFSREKALEELTKNSSYQFDKDIVKIFIKII